MRSLALSPLARKIIEAAAIDAYPKEAVGVLLGWEGAMAAYPLTTTAKRTAWQVVTDDETEHRMSEHFGSAILGEFHSHPDELPTASAEDKRELRECTTPYLGDGSFMVILGVWPGRRRPWRFRWAGYQLSGEKVHRVRLLY